MLWSHLQACAWGLLPGLLRGPTWITQFYETFPGGESKCAPSDVYIAALYWSLQTVTSVGYGQMLPVTTEERIMCNVLMLLSGFVWTYILGTAAGIAATLDPNGVVFQNTMDHLNLFMRERKLSIELRRTLRDFFVAARDVNQAGDERALFLLPPSPA